MDEIKLKILCILEEKVYQKVGIETIQKELSGVDLYRHLTYLEQKRLIRLFKIGPFAGTSEPQLLNAMLTADGEGIINTAIRKMEERSIPVEEGKGRSEPKRVRSCFLTFREQKKSPLSQQPIAERLSTTRREVNTQRLRPSKIIYAMFFVEMVKLDSKKEVDL